MGDFNIDLLKIESCSYSQKLFQSLQSLTVLPAIDKPTRSHGRSATLIDNIFLNNFDNLVLGGNVLSDVSDHFAQVCVLSSPKNCTPDTKTPRRDFSYFNPDQFNHELKHLNWSTSSDPDCCFNNFYNKLNKLTNKHAPFKKLSKRKCRQFAKPWISKGLLTSIRKKNKLYLTGQQDEYKCYRNKLTTLIRLSKRNYYHHYFETNVNNMKQTWKGINSLIFNSRKKLKQIMAIRRTDNSLSTNVTEIPNLLNNHFATVGKKLTSSLPPSKQSFTDYLPGHPITNSFFSDPIIPADIISQINALPSNEAYGLYSFPAKILKCCKYAISVPLANIFNLSVTKGKYPTKLKLTKIIPIFKEEDETCVNNYRPISLLSIFNRCFEKIMYERLVKYISKNNTLTNSQFGFRGGHNTQHAILDILNVIHKNMNNNKYTCGIFIDLKKAFDTVDHSILLSKLHFYGIRGIVNDWFRSYLFDRKQTTAVGNFVSDSHITQCGIPQGSVLGPLLFLLYVNDIVNSSKKFSFHLFADDTSILYAHRNLHQLERTVNSELLQVSNWLQANKLTLNFKKSNYMIFRPYQKLLSYLPIFKVYDPILNKSQILEMKNFVKYLGILIDFDLSWKNHIDLICQKISKTLGILARLRHTIPLSPLLKIYQALITPYLDYGICAWGAACKSYINKLLVLQKRALRLIYFKQIRDHVVPLFIDSNVLPISFIHFYRLCNIMWDVTNNIAPSNISYSFLKTTDVHHYATRSSTKDDFYVEHSKLEKVRNSFLRTGPKVWNALPSDFRNLSKFTFQKKLKHRLVELLAKADDYLEITQIIHAIKLT